MGKHLQAGLLIIVFAYFLGLVTHNKSNPQLHYSSSSAVNIIDMATVILKCDGRRTCEHCENYNLVDNIWIKIDHNRRLIISTPNGDLNYRLTVFDANLDGTDIHAFIPGPWISQLAYVTTQHEK